MNPIFTLENPAIKNGVIAGLTGAAATLVCYLINPKWALTIASWVTTILFIYLMVQSVKADKEGQEYTSFGDALKPAFLTYVVANFLFTVFYFVLLNFIAPELQEVQKEVALEFVEWMTGLLGQQPPEEMIDEIQSRDYTFSISSALLSFASGLIIPGFIVAAIIALIMKDRKPNPDF